MNRPRLPGVAEQRIVAVCRGLGPDRMPATVAALARGGVSIIEVTLDSPGALESIETLAGAGTVVGAGTCLSGEAAAAAVAAGATFLVSPHTDPAVLGWAVERGIPFIPGAFTPTEAKRAWDLGASAVKIFPASAVGPTMIAAMRGPLPDIPLIPTGGITAETAPAYLAAGAMAVGLGGWLTGANAAEVEPRAAAAVAAVGQRSER